MFAVFAPARKALTRLAVAFSAVALAACEPIALSSGPAFNTSKPVPVALLVPRGSAQGGDAILAQSLENSARLAMAELDGVKIDLRVYSTGGNAQTAGVMASQAVNEGAKIILGPLYAEAANAAGLAASQKGVNVLAFSNNTTIAGGNVFVLGPTFDNTANRLVRYAARNGKSRIGVVHANHVAGQLGKTAIENAIIRAGATHAGTVGYESSQQGVVAAVPQVRNLTKNGADAIFLTSNTARALPLFTQMLPEGGANAQLIGLTRWDIPVQTLALPGVQGGWFALPDRARSEAFKARYQAAYGQQPHPIGGLGYDGIMAIGTLVKSGNKNALSAAGLTSGAGFDGASGRFRLRADGTNERALAIATIRDKQVVEIDPAPRTFIGAGF